VNDLNKKISFLNFLADQNNSAGHKRATTTPELEEWCVQFMAEKNQAVDIPGLILILYYEHISIACHIDRCCHDKFTASKKNLEWKKASVYP